MTVINKTSLSDNFRNIKSLTILALIWKNIDICNILLYLVKL